MLRILANVAVGSAFGAVAGCLPALVGLAGFFLFPRPAPWGPYGAVVVLPSIFVPLGMVLGLIGGIIYGLKHRFLMASSPCIGTIFGGAVTALCYAMSEKWMDFAWLPPAIGGLLGCAYSVLAWRSASSGTTKLTN